MEPPTVMPQSSVITISSEMPLLVPRIYTILQELQHDITDVRIDATMHHDELRALIAATHQEMLSKIATISETYWYNRLWRWLIQR